MHELDPIRSFLSGAGVGDESQSPTSELLLAAQGCIVRVSMESTGLMSILSRRYCGEHSVIGSLIISVFLLGAESR